MKPKRIGLISDTHGLLRPEAAEALRGSELILHAGDVGKPEILEALRKIAPVVAVRGNVDTEAWAHALPMTAIAEASAAMIYMIHDVKEMDLNPATARFQIVVSDALWGRVRGAEGLPLKAAIRLKVLSGPEDFAVQRTDILQRFDRP